MELTEEILEMIKELEDDELLVIVMGNYENGGGNDNQSKT